MPLRIHPGIGVARVGDSPEVFIGPETVDAPTPPPGGYRDDEGRIRRQGARFRLFEDGEHVVSGDDVSIRWTVHLAGGVGTITGTDRTETVTDGTTALGEIRTDSEGNLIVLSRQLDESGGGCADGSVEADLTRGTTTIPAIAAWVTIAPPRFVPGRFPALPYHLLILDWLVVSRGLGVPPATTNLSFRRDIYPAIRGRTPLSVVELLALTTRDDRVAAVPFFVPSFFDPIGEGAYLRAVIEHFHDGAFDSDWDTLTPLVPDELDRGPLSFIDATCPGGGWELRLLPIPAGDDPIAVGETLRFDPTRVAPGVTRPFAIWANDLRICGSEWVRVVDAPFGYGRDWRLRGFMVQAAGTLEYREWVPRFALLTTELDFGFVQQGSGVARMLRVNAINFYEPASIEFIRPLPPGLSTPAFVTSTGQTSEGGTIVEFPVFFQAALDAPLGSTPPASLEVRIDGEPVFVPIVAEIVAAESAQLGLVVDCSFSMTEDRGDGESKFFGLKQALDVLIDVARPNDGLAIAPFSDDALATHTARRLGDGGIGDTRREEARVFVRDLLTYVNTSIGDGLVSARELLTRTPDSFDREALIVITDGKETADAYIEDVASTIDQQTFAIGIGTSANVDAETLRDLTGNRRGYLMLTGDSISATNRYRLEKYLLQILAGATNEQVVVDPTGTLVPGGVARIPIPVTELDFRLDVIVVSDEAEELLLALMGPDGEVRTFETLASEPGVQVVRRPRVGMARVPVPLTFLSSQRFSAGTWYLLIAQRAHTPHDVSNEALAKHLFAPRRKAVVLPRGKTSSYAAVVNVRSALRLGAHAAELLDRGAHVVVEAAVDHAGIPLRTAPVVVADVETPFGLGVEMPLEVVGPGRYLGRIEALHPGEYVTRVRARGTSPAGHLFARELTLTPSLPGKRQGGEPCRPRRGLSDRLCDYRDELKRIVSCITRSPRRRG